MSVATITGKALTAIAGVAMFASATVSPVSAMPLTPLMGGAEVGSPVQEVWYDRWGYWHPNYFYGGYYADSYPGYYYYHRHHHHHHFAYRCWWGHWGYRHCDKGYAWGNERRGY